MVKKSQPRSERQRGHLTRHGKHTGRSISYMASVPQGNGFTPLYENPPQVVVHPPRRRGKYATRAVSSEQTITTPDIQQPSIKQLKRLLAREEQIRDYYNHLINYVAPENRPSIRLTGTLEINIKGDNRDITDAHLSIPGIEILAYRKTVRKDERLPPVYNYETVVGVAFDFAYTGNLPKLIGILCDEEGIYSRKEGVSWRLSNMVDRHPLGHLDYTVQSSPP